MSQISLFDTEAGKAALSAVPEEAVARSRRADSERRKAVSDFAWKVQSLLAEHGLFGYPNLVSNPADDEQELVQRRGVSLPEAHRIRWPGNWLIEDKEGAFSVRLVAREDQEANPAILKAQGVLQAAGIPACISTPDPSDPAKGSRFYH